MYGNNFAALRSAKAKTFYNFIFDINFYRLFYASDKKGVEIPKPGG